MKITPEHYTHMEQAIKGQLALYPANQHMDYLRWEAKAKDYSKRLRWDYLWMSGLSGWLTANVYSYANDDHVDTALRHIFQKHSA